MLLPDINMIAVSPEVPSPHFPSSIAGNRLYSMINTIKRHLKIAGYPSHQSLIDFPDEGKSLHVYKVTPCPHSLVTSPLREFRE